jgi:hypothetical protein
MLSSAIAVAIAAAAAAASAGQSQECSVGTRVEFEDGRGGVGEIREIGTSSPHVGWYRIVQSWNAPSGEWYPPKTWAVYVAGTKTRCGASPAAPAATGKGADSGAAIAGDVCPFVEPPGTVSRSSTASAALFKRVIYQRAAASVNPASVSAPKKVGLTFLAFELGEPYENTLTADRVGDRRLHTGAPVGAMIHPVTTRELQCDLHGAQVRRTLTEVSRSCFKNRDGDWVCPGRSTKTIESRLISVR